MDLTKYSRVFILFAFLCGYVSPLDISSLSYAHSLSHNEVSGDGGSNTTLAHSPCEVETVLGGVIVNCRQRSISSMDPSWFPDNTLKLYLDHNSIRTIPGNIFSNLKKLEYLSLKGNEIRNVDIHAFQGLDKLAVLNLENNLLELSNDSYPPDVFGPLTNLRVLRLIQGWNPRSSVYPQGFIFSLINLEALGIDAIGESLHFGVEFCNFKHLRYLDITGYFSFVNHETFSYLSCTHGPLELKITGSNMATFDDEALRPLNNSLTTLHLKDIHIGVQLALGVLKPLQGMHMEEIRLDRMSLNNNHAETGITTRDGVITASSSRYLRNICVKRFSLTKSNVFVVDANSFAGGFFDACLREIDLSRNVIYGTGIALMRLLHLHHLEAFISVERKPQYQRNILTQDVRNSYGNYAYEEPESHLESTNNSPPYIEHTEHSDRTVVITFSKYFRRFVYELNGMHASNQLSIHLKFKNSANLSALICRSCGLHELTGRISGVEHVKNVDLSYNDLSTMRKGYLDSFESLEKLVLNQVNFDPRFISKHSARLLQNLTNLRTIDMSGNNLCSLSDQMFVYNEKLEEIFLANNRFKHVPFNFVQTPNVKYLDLSNNALASLSTPEMANLDNRAALSPQTQMSLFLKDNILSCACEDVKFLHWLRTTHVHLDNNGDYECIDENGQLKTTMAHKDLKALWRLCMGKIYFWISLFLLACITTGFVLGTLSLKYSNFYKALLLSFVLKKLTMKTRKDYRYGAFIGYASSEYRFPFLTLRRFLEEDLGIRTCVEHRDFLGNHDMATCIMEAIQSSWRTVLVVTDQFLSHDQWSAFAMKFAVYAQGPENPARIVLIVQDDVRHRVPLWLLGAVNDDNVISLPRLRMCYELRQRLKFLFQEQYE